ncbi:MAG: hypothetical protein ACJ76D_01355 [Solirubrobacterales bacterium]
MVTVAGLASGSHLELAMTEGALVVEGAMEPAESVGCSYGRRHRVARCPVDGVGGVELQMNDAEDRVRVLTPLPLPLTVHLGGGSDKFVGNAEPDTCYSQGARRNRCVGGAGDDVCITGQMNSDCVGGPGDDVCRHGAGSDGCWGGPGDDVCSMGPGSDGCHGGPGDDRLLGGPGADQLYGGPGRDYCDGAPGVGHSFRCEEGPGG